MSKGKLAVLAIILASVAAFFIFDLRQYLSIEYFERQRAAIEAYRAAHPVEAVAAFFAVYVVATALSLPGATILTLPRVAVLRSFVMNHIIHHRAQLGVYLRLNDVAVPSIYGPSADEGIF